MLSIAEILSQELGQKLEYVQNVIALMDEGNTIPFIARYRKEMHGAMDDTALRTLETRLTYLRNLQQRREEVIGSIESQGKLTEELEKAIDQQMENLKAQLSHQGLTIEMYCSFLGNTVEDIREEMKASAENSVKIDATIAKIVELEKLTATEEEIGQALSVICRQNNITLEELKPHYNAELEQAVIKSVLTSKVMHLIRDAAEVVVL